MAFRILMMTAGLSPAFVLFDEPICLAVVALAAALALGVALMAMRPAGGAHLWRLVRPFALMALVPAALLVVQLIPLPFGWSSSPIWDSAKAASPQRLASRISVDFGATVIALLRYLAACAIVLATAMTTVDRRRAEQFLLVISVAPFLVALLLAAHAFGANLVSFSFAGDAIASARIAVGLGAVFAAASAMRAFERHETRGAQDRTSDLGYLRESAFFAALCGLYGLVLCWLSPGAQMIAAALGFAAVPALIVVRRLGFGSWGLGVVTAMLLVGVALLALSSPDLFGARTAVDAATAAQRMVADAPALGSGGGTFSAMASLYLVGPAGAMGLRSAAGAMVVEMGAGFLAYVVVAAATAAIILLAGALERGRDSFYPLAGAAVLILLLAMGFVGPGPSNLATLIPAACGLGLAMSQRAARTAS